MSYHVGEAYRTGSVSPENLGLAVRPIPNVDPEQYINVRLVNGSAFYTAGGTSISGGAVLTADQGAPGLLSSAWPVKITDGTTIFGLPESPFSVYLSSGSLGNQQNPIWITGSFGPTPPNQTTALSGSLTGLLVGGIALAGSNPLPVTGSVSLSRAISIETLPAITGSVSLTEPVTIANVVTITGSVTTLSGSVIGLLAGGQSTSVQNPLSVQTIDAPNLQYLYDVGSGSIYVGYAPRAVSPASSLWTIKRTLLDISGNPTEAKWTITGSWDLRAALSYT